MPNYKEMYFKMFRASEQAINILIKAGQECEELYVSSPGPKVQIIELPSEKKKGLNGE